MAWRPLEGPYKYSWFRKTASQVFTTGALVDVVDGLITVCTITRAPHSGIIQKAVAATDSDYAATTRLPLLVPSSPTTKFRVSVLSTDTAVITDVGNFFDIGGSPVGIDVTRATSADDAFLVSDFFGANDVGGYLNSFKPMQPGIGTAT